MDTQVSLPCSQNAATVHYPEQYSCYEVEHIRTVHVQGMRECRYSSTHH